jgi:hypothetical protein
VLSGDFSVDDDTVLDAGEILERIAPVQEENLKRLDDDVDILKAYLKTQSAPRTAIEALEGLTVEQHVSWKKAVARREVAGVLDCRDTFLNTIHHQSGVTQASIQSESIPQHLPQPGDDIKYVDESGNIRQGTITKRTFKLRASSRKQTTDPRHQPQGLIGLARVRSLLQPLRQAAGCRALFRTANSA